MPKKTIYVREEDIPSLTRPCRNLAANKAWVPCWKWNSIRPASAGRISVVELFCVLYAVWSACKGHKSIDVIVVDVLINVRTIAININELGVWAYIMYRYMFFESVDIFKNRCSCLPTPYILWTLSICVLSEPFLTKVLQHVSSHLAAGVGDATDACGASKLSGFAWARVSEVTIICDAPHMLSCFQ